MSLPSLLSVQGVSSLTSGAWDAAVVVGPEPVLTDIAGLDHAISSLRAVDRRVDHDVTCSSCAEAPGGRLVVSPTGPLGRDYDDVRRFGEAARLGVRRALAAGATRPLLIVRGVPSTPRFAHAGEVAVLEALGAAWSPLEAREARGEVAVEPMTALGWLGGPSSEERLGWLTAVEHGRRVARDVTGTEPERMAPARVAELCRSIFRDTPVSVSVVDDRTVLEREYPLLSAVGRASFAVPRHQPCVVRLSYEGEGPIEQSFLIAGKGVTYDTGGADVKYGGAMAGMSRDKGGAGAAIGLMATVAARQPKGLKVVVEVGAVRNSLGADGFVTDEIITSHAGVRVRIGNTDAEGRLVLADLLSQLKLQAVHSPRPRLFSMATLTGHVGRAYGTYTASLDNGPALLDGVTERLARFGDLWGEPVEISRLRREDWDFVRPRTASDDVLSCNNGASTMTARGHQFPMAFLAVASGLARHGVDGSPPLPYTHIDIGGSAVEGGDWQHGRPTGTPILAFASAYLG